MPANLKKLNHRHQQICNWLLMHPDRTQGDCARELNYTEAWLSMIINSDAFQALYQQRAEATGQVAVHSIANKLKGVAGLALEKAAEKLQGPMCSEQFLGNTMKETLKALGYSGNDTQPQYHQHEHIHVDGTLLVQARERALASVQGTTRGKLVATSSEAVVPAEGVG